MYWKNFDNNKISAQIDAALGRDDVTLQNLMDEDDILQECKTQNKKLVDFLLRPEVMEELVLLTTTEPDVEIDERERYKYPNLACEMLTSDIPVLNERLVSDQVLLSKLYSFIESDAPLNPLLASYFCRTLVMLVSQKNDYYSCQVICLQVFEFLKSKGNFVDLLLKHLGTSAIMDLLFKLITSFQGVTRENFLTWLDEQHVVQSIVYLLNPHVDVDRQCNASQLLCDIIEYSREQLLSDGTKQTDQSDIIIDTLESCETISYLLETILTPDYTESSLVSGIQVLLALLNFNKRNPACDDAISQSRRAEEQTHRETVINAVALAILPKIHVIQQILLNPPKKPSVETTVGVLDPPLGNTRLHIARLCANLLACNHVQLNEEIARAGTLRLLLDLFFTYGWNNFLHREVEQCVIAALTFKNVKKDLATVPEVEYDDNNVNKLNVEVTEALNELRDLNNEISEELRVLKEKKDVEECDLTSGGAKKMEKEVKEADKFQSDETLDDNIDVLHADNVMLKIILVDCDLMNRILHVCENNEIEQSKQGRRHGYMGHLINIANCIRLVCNEEGLDAFIQSNLGLDTYHAWRTFVDDQLEKENCRQTFILGGCHPNHTDFNQDISSSVAVDNGYAFSNDKDLDGDNDSQGAFFETNQELQSKAEDEFNKICVMNEPLDDDEDMFYTLTAQLANERTDNSSDEETMCDDENNDVDNIFNDARKTLSSKKRLSRENLSTLADPWTNAGIASTSDEGWADFNQTWDNFNNVFTPFVSAPMPPPPSSSDLSASDFDLFQPSKLSNIIINSGSINNVDYSSHDNDTDACAKDIFTITNSFPKAMSSQVDVTVADCPKPTNELSVLNVKALEQFGDTDKNKIVANECFNPKNVTGSLSADETNEKIEVVKIDEVAANDNLTIALGDTNDEVVDMEKSMERSDEDSIRAAQVDDATITSVSSNIVKTSVPFVEPKQIPNESAEIIEVAKSVVVAACEDEEVCAADVGVSQIQVGDN